VPWEKCSLSRCGNAVGLPNYEPPGRNSVSPHTPRKLVNVLNGRRSRDTLVQLFSLFSSGLMADGYKNERTGTSG
jgi:hypothetical protein